MYVGVEYHAWVAWDAFSLILRGLALLVLGLAVWVRRKETVVW